MQNIHEHIRKDKDVPQTEKALKGQKKNNAGGYVFKISKWDRLERFLILGTEGGSFYVRESKLTIDSIKSLEKCLKEDFTKTVDMIVSVSVNGLAAKQEPVLLALAVILSKGSVEEKRYASSKFNEVCRTFTHLAIFINYAKALRGGGRLLSRTYRNWILSKSADDLAYQFAKYTSREGFSVADLLKIAHPKTKSAKKNAVFRWALKEGYGKRTVLKPGAGGKVIEYNYEKVKLKSLPKILVGRNLAMEATTSQKVSEYIYEFGLTHEMIPNEVKNDKIVWQTLIERGMPYTALLRNLGKISSIGGLQELKENTTIIAVTDHLTNENAIKKSKVHPLTIYNALKTYASERGDKGKLSWEANRYICEALENAFYKSFEFVEPTKKKTLYGIDISGSMSMGNCAGMSNLTPREACALMTMATMNSENPNDYSLYGFCTKFTKLDIYKSMRINDVCYYMSSLSMGGTDCALPMIHATKKELEVDTFIIMTDSETWGGSTHPFKALQEYRNNSGIPAKLIVVAFVSTPFTIANADDAGMIDIVGCSPNTPRLIAQFSVKEVANNE